MAVGEKDYVVQLDSSGAAWAVWGNKDRQLAQSFMSSETFMLKKISLYLERVHDPILYYDGYSTAPVYVEITADDNGKPGETIAIRAIYTTDFENINTPTWKDITFPNEVKIVAQTKYWIYLYMTTGSPTTDKWLRWYTAAAETNPYGQGTGKHTPGTGYPFTEIYGGISGDDFSFMVWGTYAEDPLPEKSFLVVIRDKSRNYLGTLTNINFSGFRKQINGGLGELTFKLPANYKNFGEGKNIKLGNRVDVYVSDIEDPNRKIYSGYISNYTVSIEGKSQEIEITLLSWWSRLSKLLFKTDTSATISYTSQDSGWIVRQIARAVKNQYPSLNLTIKEDIPNTQTLVSYVFQGHTITEAIERCRMLSPPGYWYYFDSDDTLHFKKIGAFPKHFFIFGRHFRSVHIRKNLEGVVNNFYFWNGKASGETGAYACLYKAQDSIDEFGEFVEKNVDSRVSDTATADAWATAFLNTNRRPVTEVTLEIIDNTVSYEGYDIESIEPGDTVRILNLPKEISLLLNEDLQVASVEYRKHVAIVELERLSTSISRSIAEIKSEILDRSYSSSGAQPTYIVKGV